MTEMKILELSKTIEDKKYCWKLEYQLADFGYGTCVNCGNYGKISAKYRQIENDWGDPIDSNYNLGCHQCTKDVLEDLAFEGNTVPII